MKRSAFRKPRGIAHRLMVGLVTGVLFLSACGQKAEQKPESKPVESKKVESVGGAATVAPPERFTKVLTGKIGTYDITVHLIRNGEVLAGAYTYETARPGLRGMLNALSLQGKVEADGSVKIQETEFKAKSDSETEKPTGFFKGRISATGTAENFRVKIEGEWSKPDGSKSAPFSMAEEAFDGLAIALKQIRDENKAEHYEFGCEYVQINDRGPHFEAFNREMETFVKAEQADFKKSVVDWYKDQGGPKEKAGNFDSVCFMDMAAEVLYADRNFISVRFMQDYFFDGAAHPSGGTLVFNFDFRKGKRVRLSDLFQPNTEYLKRLSEICAKLEKENDDYGDLSTDPTPENYEKWSVNRKGFIMNFEVAHVLGNVVEAYVPFSEVKDLIDPAGPLSGAVKP